MARAGGHHRGVLGPRAGAARDVLQPHPFHLRRSWRPELCVCDPRLALRSERRPRDPHRGRLVVSDFGAGVDPENVPPEGAAARVEVRPVWPDGPSLVAGGFHLRCRREPWLGMKATAAACAAAVLAQPAQNCSHTFFVWGNVGSGNCACAPPQSRCVDGDGLVYAAASSLYQTSAKAAKDAPVAPRRDGFRGAEALP